MPILSPMANAFVQLHISIILAGFTGIIGKIITMSEGLLVWYRMFFAFVVFGFYLMYKGEFEKISLKDFSKIGITGVLIALHWLFFYGSVKLANVSIAVVCFSLVGFFTAILEPIFMRTRFSMREFVFSLLTVFGVCLIFSFDVRYRLGIIVGIISALLSALYVISIRKLCHGYSSNTTLLYQMGSGVFFLTLIMPWYLKAFEIKEIIPSFQDAVLLFILAVFCTIWLTMLLIKSLKFISAFTVNLSFNLEPIYSIILAIAFLGEATELSYSFYIGLSFIMLSVCLQSYWVAGRK